jgi:hypothetical protein
MSWREATQLIPRTTENEHQTGLGGDRGEESRPKAASHNGVTCSRTRSANVLMQTGSSMHEKAGAEASQPTHTHGLLGQEASSGGSECHRERAPASARRRSRGLADTARCLEGRDRKKNTAR